MSQSPECNRDATVLTHRAAFLFPTRTLSWKQLGEARKRAISSWERAIDRGSAGRISPPHEAGGSCFWASLNTGLNISKWFSMWRQKGGFNTDTRTALQEPTMDCCKAIRTVWKHITYSERKTPVNPNRQTFKRAAVNWWWEATLCRLFDYLAPSSPAEGWKMELQTFYFFCDSRGCGRGWQQTFSEVFPPH